MVTSQLYMRLRCAVFYVFVLIAFSSVFAESSAQLSTQKSPGILELNNGWEYRWEKSSFKPDGTVYQLFPDTTNKDWMTALYNQGVQIDDLRRSEESLWLRVQLPAGHWKDPHLFILNMPFTCEVYLSERTLFDSREIPDRITTQLVAPFWRMIPLDANFQEKILYFRISNRDWRTFELGGIFVGSKSDFIVNVIGENIYLLILGFLFITVGLVPLLVFIQKRKDKGYFAFSLFTISFGFWTIADTIRLLALFWNLSNFQFNVLVIFPYLTPVGLCLYFEHIFGVGYKSIIRRLWQIHLVFAVVSAIILLFKLLPLYYLLKINLLFFLGFFATQMVLLTTSILAAIKGRTDARIITAGFLIFALFGFYDILGGILGLIPFWTQVIYPWGLLLFILSLGIVLERKFSKAHEQLQEYSKGLEIKVSERTKDLQKKNEALESTLTTLKRTQTKLVQSEKMAALGKLTAGIAHEINNPIGALKSTMDILIRCAEKIKKIPGSDQKLFNILEENSRVALSASDRVAGIVESLKNFTRLDEAEFQKVDIHEGIVSTLNLIQNLIKDEIRLVKNFGDVPEIYCYPGELNQVMMTILTNAVEALDNQGTISVETFADKELVYIKISDTGKGISSEKLKTLFDVNFATKTSRIGMGMGLSNAHYIVQKHDGAILVDSRVGQGTSFTISLPVNRE